MKSDTIQFYTINLASFFSQLAIAMINLTLVYHLRYHYDLPSAMIGLAAAMSPTSYLLSCLVKGRLPSNLRPRHDHALLGRDEHFNPGAFERA